MKKKPSHLAYEFFYTLNPLLLLAAFILLSLYMNETVIKFRLQEFDSGLKELSEKEALSHSVNILARFEMIKERLNNPNADETELKREVKFHAITSNDLVSGSSFSFSPSEKLVIHLINGLRIMMGKKISQFGMSGNSEKSLEVAYFYERNRNYKKAIAEYETLLSESWPSQILSTIYLHLGFCKAMTGDYKGSRDDIQYITSRDEFTGSDNWKVAWKMEKELSSLESRAAKLKEEPLDLLERGKELFRMGNHIQAAKVLKEFIEESPKKKVSESQYFLGRVNEDEGRFEDAVLNYTKVLKNEPTSDWAQKANRRLYVLGKFYSKNEQLADVAKRNSQVLGDTSIIRELEVFEKIEEAKPEDNPLPPAPDTTAKKQEESQTADSLEAISKETIATKDSATQKLEKSPEETKAEIAEKEKVQKILEILEDIRLPEKPLEEAEQEMVAVQEKGEMTEEERRKLEKKDREIISDPIRTKEIFSVIKARSTELQYVYEKWKKKGLVGQGQLELVLVISPQGEVREVRIENVDRGINSDIFEKELVERIQKWKFRQKKGTTQDVAVNFPISFISRDARSAGP